METTRSPPGSVRRHGRNVSRTQAARRPLEEVTDEYAARTDIESTQAE